MKHVSEFLTFVCVDIDFLEICPLPKRESLYFFSTKLKDSSMKRKVFVEIKEPTLLIRVNVAIIWCLSEDPVFRYLPPTRWVFPNDGSVCALTVQDAALMMMTGSLKRS